MCGWASLTRFKNIDFLSKLYMFITIFKNSRCFITRDLSVSIFCLIVSRFLTVDIINKRPRNFPDLQFSLMKTNHYWMRSFCRGLAFTLLVRVQTFVRQMINWNVMFSWFWIAHFTVTGGNEAGVDLVLIQPFLLFYVNHVVLMLTSIF